MTTLPDKPASTVLWPKKQVGLIALDITLVFLLAATLLPPIHCAAGTVLLMGCTVHMALHRRWIKAVIWNSPKNIPPSRRHQRLFFWSLLLCGLICGLSAWVIGLGTLLAALQPHFSLLLHCCGIPIHVLSGLAFWGLNIYHLAAHRNWFRNNLTIHFTKRGG